MIFLLFFLKHGGNGKLQDDFGESMKMIIFLYAFQPEVMKQFLRFYVSFLCLIMQCIDFSFHLNHFFFFTVVLYIILDDLGSLTVVLEDQKVVKKLRNLEILQNFSHQEQCIL